MRVEVKGNVVFVDGVEYCRVVVEREYLPFGSERFIEKKYSKNFGRLKRLVIERNADVRRAIEEAERNLFGLHFS